MCCVVKFRKELQEFLVSSLTPLSAPQHGDFCGCFSSIGVIYSCEVFLNIDCYKEARASRLARFRLARLLGGSLSQGSPLVLMSCDDKKIFLFVCVVIASQINKFLISDVIVSG
jgi:hypothetical protein